MGNVDSCCSTEPAQKRAVIHETTTYADVLSETEIEQFKKRLEDEIGVLLLLSDGTRLSCTMKLDVVEQTLNMYCEANLRVVHLSEIFKILHERDQLRRIETKASLVDDTK